MKTLINRTFKYGILSIFFMLILYLTLLSMFSTCEVGVDPETGSFTMFLTDRPWVHILCLVTVTAGLYFLRRKAPAACLKSKLVWAARHPLFLFAAGGVLWVLTTQLTPRFDQANVLKTAGQLKELNFAGYLPGGYLDIWPNQQGIVLFYYFLSFLIGDNNYIAIQLLNVFFLTAAFYLFRLSAQMFWGKAGPAVSLACMAFFPAFLYISFVYGEIPGLFFSTAAVYLELKYFEEKRLIRAVGSALLISIAIALKMNNLILLIAMLIYAVYELLVHAERKKALLLAALLLLCYALSGQAVRAYTERLTGIPASGGVPAEAYLAMGMQEGGMAAGAYNGYNLDSYVRSGCNHQAAAEQAGKDIKASLELFREHPGAALSFYGRKIANQWNNPTFLAFNSLGTESAINKPPLAEHILQGRLSYLLYDILNLLQTGILFGVLFYLAGSLRKIESRELLFPLIFIGGFLFHLFWEAGGRYALPYFVLLLPYSVRGYSVCLDRMEAYAADWKENRRISRKGYAAAGLGILVLIPLLLLPAVGGKSALFTGLFAIRDPNGQASYFAYHSMVDQDLALKNGYYTIAPVSDEALSLCGASEEYVLLGEACIMSVFKKDKGRVLRFYDTQTALDVASTATVCHSGTEAPYEWRLLPADESGVYYITVNGNEALTCHLEDWTVNLTPFTGEESQKWRLTKASIGNIESGQSPAGMLE